MSGFHGLRELLRSLFRRGEVEREMREEVRFHLENEVESNIRRGMSPAEARRRAHRDFGGVDRFQEETRDVRGGRRLEDLVRDIGYGVRTIRRAPGTAMVAVLTMALGIGAATSVFSVVKAVLVDPLPYASPESLVSLWGRFLPESGFDFPQFSLSPPEYFDYRANNRSMSDVAAMNQFGATLQPESGDAERIQASRVTANLFGLLGVSPLLGRGFTAEEDVPGGPDVAVVSWGLWQRAFGGDPGIVGRTIRVNGYPTEVVGVMPEGFSFPTPDLSLWTTLGLDPARTDNRQSHYLMAVGRLASGATLETAQAEMSVMMASWKAEYPTIHTGHFLFLRSLIDDTVGDVRRALLVLFGAVGVIMLIVGANVSSIQIARSSTRQREVAVRAAIGGSRQRLVQQFFTESAILAFAGGIAGVLLARLGISAIVAASAGAIPRADGIDVDPVVTLFALAITALSALIAGTLPAMRAATADPQAALREGDRAASQGRSHARLRSGLVVTEVALAVVIIAAAGLMIRSFRTLVSVDPGFESRDVLTVSLALPGGRYADSTSIVAFFDRAVERVRALPGVTRVSAGSALPLMGSPGVWDFGIEGRADPGPGEVVPNGQVVVFMPDYAAIMGINVVEGRFFEPGDRAGAPLVTVINRKLARVFFPGESAIGHRIRVSGPESAPWLTIVGVVDDLKYSSLDEDALFSWYVPFAQSQPALGYVPRSMTIVVRRDGDAVDLAQPIRNTIRELDAELPIISMATTQSIVDRSLARPRFTLRLFSAFAILALVLGIVGLYGTLSCTVAERSREVGIRRALGARTASILGDVVGRSLRLTLLGLGIGIVAALAGTRSLRGLLFGIEPTDPATYTAVVVTMVAAAIAAALVPAVRAVRQDPLRVLRGD